MTARSAISSGVALVLLACHISLSARQAQPDNGAPASFEVASVKPHKDGTSSGGSSQPNGGYRVTNVSLKSIIANAFEVRIFEIEGDPAWITTERFDINARGREGTPDRLRTAMLRTLLAERFKLAVHFETRDVPLSPSW